MRRPLRILCAAALILSPWVCRSGFGQAARPAKSGQSSFSQWNWTADFSRGIRGWLSYPLAQDIGWTRDDEVEIGYRYHRAAWGRGIATEAAMPLLEAALADADTAAIVACALAANRASLRVLEKLGLQRAGEVTLPGIPGPTVKLERPCAGGVPREGA